MTPIKQLTTKELQLMRLHLLTGADTNPNKFTYTIKEISEEIEHRASQRFPASDEMPDWNNNHTEQNFL
jgi:hypothetical protein